jgi:hypothetical protein
MEDRTIAVSHKLANVHEVPPILMLDRGCIVGRSATGNSMERPGVYARLYALHSFEADAGASRALTTG